MSNLLQSFAIVPTTRVLAIGRFPESASESEVHRLLHDKVVATVRLYLGGKIDQWYARQDRGGVVFVMDVDRVEEAERLLNGLPLGRSGLLVFDFVPLGPIRALDALLPQ